MLAGAKLIVIDPRRTDMVDFADMFIQLKVGSDVALINALMNVLITENLYDKKYVESCTDGFEELKEKGDGISAGKSRRRSAAFPPIPFANWPARWLPSSRRC